MAPFHTCLTVGPIRLFISFYSRAPRIGGQTEKTKRNLRAAVVAQLVEWLLRIPEVHGSNQVIEKNLY